MRQILKIGNFQDEALFFCFKTLIGSTLHLWLKVKGQRVEPFIIEAVFSFDKIFNLL